MRNLLLSLTFILSSLLGVTDVQAQQFDETGWAARSAAVDRYWVFPDRVYGTQGGQALKLDIWKPRDRKQAAPTLIYIHGGGWLFGDRAGAAPLFLPFIEMGWNVVNVDYRMSPTALAPAAVEDCRCALRWVMRNAKEYGIDTERLVLTGHSAGGHLALTTALLQPSDGMDRLCPGTEPLKVAAVVNWYGPTDVADLIEGPNSRDWAISWVGGQADRMQVAKQVSPLTYVRSGLPPIITVHGEQDDVVPYSHGVRLHEALEKARVPNQFVTIKGGGHGMFTAEEVSSAYRTIREFLKKHMNVP